LALLLDDGLAGAELADDVVGFAGESCKKFSSLVRKLGSRLTITSAGGGGSCKDRGPGSGGGWTGRD
jgi:hypothetical protein